MASEQKRQYDLTEGSIIGKLVLVALPIMGTQLMMMTYNLADMFWLGRLSADAVAASGSAGMFLWLSQAMMMIARMGAEIGVSQHMGRGEVDRARRFSQNAIFLGVVMGLLYGGALILFNKPFIGFFKIQEAHVAADAAAYLAAVGFGIPMAFVTSAVTGTFNASGNSRLPFFINTIGLVVNMILDPVMIFTMDMGIVGAAVATVIGQSVVCVLSLIALKFHRERPFESMKLFTGPDGDIVRQIFKWCIPIGLESALFTLLGMIIARFVASFGSTAIAVQRVGSQIESLSWLIGSGLGSAFTAFVGQNYGARKWERIHKGYRAAMAFAIFWGSLVMLLMMTLGGPLYGIFLKEADVILIGMGYMRILALCQIPGNLEGISAGAFKGMGRTLPPSVNSISINACRVVLCYVLSRPSMLGLTGIWVGLTVGAAIRGTSIFIWWLLTARKLPREDEDLTPSNSPSPDPA